jgi:hypothetical protein
MSNVPILQSSDGAVIRLAGVIAAILVRHGVIDFAAIADPEGYDAGITKQRVMDATIQIAKEFQQ